MITCNRCGKENQDHYKFCLGCGSELVKPAAPGPSAGLAPTPPPVVSAPVATPPAAAAPEAAIETARTMLPPGPPASAVAGELRTPSPAGAKPRGGIPWNDSPRMPDPIPFQLPPNPLAGATPGPRLTSSGTTNGGPASAATPPPVAARPTGGAGSLPSAGSMAPTPPPVMTNPAAGAELACPTCGKPVQVGFAFCGACGTRIARPANAAASAAAAPPRTMFMAGSTAAAPAVVPRGRLILIRPDGSEGGAHPLHDGENIIGRGQAALFDADAYLSPRHAELSVGPEGVTIRDLQSLNGIFLKIGGEEPLESGDIFRIGQELLRFEVISPPQPLEDGTEIMGTPNPGFWGRLSVIVGRDVDGSAFPLFGESIVLGRERGDILFPEDGYVSGTHSRIALHGDRVFLTDLGSSNGTFLRLRHERVVPTGSFLLMGQQLFRLEFR
ncbi:MAG TPA: FHA domain-containing protein [Polyangia bacterium]|nr:FHA domain-containing protein [Polyangia bacterium]